jgi:hypothetical protein
MLLVVVLLILSVMNSALSVEAWDIDAGTFSASDSTHDILND